MEDNKNVDVNNKEADNKEINKIEITQEELDKKIQQAIYTNSQNEKKKYEKELQKQKSLMEMDEQSRLVEEKKQLEQQLAEIQLTNLKYETAKVLNNKGMSAEFVDFVVGNDTETTQANIENLDKLFKKAVSEEVSKRVTSTGTKNSNNSINGTMTKEQFRKMSIAEQTKLFNENPELYKQLTNR
ncbi:MAG: DUF4355 domain-containing protein [Sedimentibacter sp.]|uniref:DUF4355 domain-containing protein n=1 Tax=Sedimentibacter sp. TaxID=1960295 RepID=UPI002981CA5A|nr:DUF4355 domain-containing protein [Sedimentibacter sp.]MDW5300632.1 DUF4355 domain-containing protein [Sedimentibacter sp.]